MRDWPEDELQGVSYDHGEWVWLRTGDHAGSLGQVSSCFPLTVKPRYKLDEIHNAPELSYPDVEPLYDWVEARIRKRKETLDVVGAWLVGVVVGGVVGLLI